MIATREMNSTTGQPIKTRIPQKYHDDPSPGVLTTFLGVFSIGLGLAEMMRPPKVAARTGVPYPKLVRLYGAREIVTGIGILSSRRPAGWLWARVAGDVLDLATLGGSATQVGESGQRRAAQSAAAVGGVLALDLVAAIANSR
jgi:hypothetical protein